jgi:hypothetical protein
MTFIKRNQFFMHELYHSEIIVKKFRSKREIKFEKSSHSDNTSLIPKNKKDTSIKIKNKKAKDSADCFINKQFSYMSPRISLSKNSRIIYFEKFHFNSNNNLDSLKENDNGKDAYTKKNNYAMTGSPKNQINI